MDQSPKLNCFEVTKTSHSHSIVCWEWINLNPKNKINHQPILFIGGVHGDEPEGVWLAECLLHWIQSKTFKHQLVELNSFLLITCLNPDGYLKNERVNGRGVDLNRNFPTPDWTQESKAPRYFPGHQPASENETAGLVQLIERYSPRLIVHFHSWNPCIIYTGEPAKEVALKFSRVTTYPAQDDIGYPTPGSLGQYGWFSKKIPVLCLEEREGTPKDQIWQRWSKLLCDLIKC